VDTSFLPKSLRRTVALFLAVVSVVVATVAVEGWVQKAAAKETAEVKADIRRAEDLAAQRFSDIMRRLERIERKLDR
jgi:hypothetical protein